MQFDLEICCDVEGSYVPGTPPVRAADGVWQAGDGPYGEVQVMWRGQDITKLLNTNELQLAEDAWIEHNEGLR